MNILELSDFSSNYGSNFIPSLCALEDLFSKKGHCTFFILPTKNKSKKFYEWEVPFSAKHNVTLMDFTNYSIVKNVVLFIKKNNIKIVHAHFIASFYLSEIKKYSPRDVVFYEHIHSAPFRNQKTFKAKIKRIRNFILLNKKITKICVSSSIKNMTQYVYPRCKVVVCKNAIDFGRLKKNYSVSHDDFKILLFGYNYYVKGVDIALESIIEFSKIVNAHLDIVMSDNLKKNVNIILEKYKKIPNCLTILEPEHDVSKLYSEHQVYLNASRSEGFSYANLEAYYSGLQCVFSDIPAIKEANLPNVIYFESGNVKSLISALKKAYQQRNNFKNDLEYIENNFSLQKWAEDVACIMSLF